MLTRDRAWTECRFDKRCDLYEKECSSCKLQEKRNFDSVSLENYSISNSMEYTQGCKFLIIIKRILVQVGP